MLDESVGVDARRKPSIDLHALGDNISLAKNNKF